MSDIKMVGVPMSTLFKSKRGNSAYTKSYCNAHKGAYLVYTGTTIGDFAAIDTFEYEKDQLSYTTDGVNAGTVEILTGKYNVGGHRAILVPESDDLCIEYFGEILEPILKKKMKDGNVPSVTWTNIKSQLVPVPMINDKYDIEEQRRIANELKLLRSRKETLRQYLEELSDSYIDIPLKNYKYKTVPLNELFNYERGQSCTREYCNKHRGNIPVWSANNSEPLAYVDFNTYEGEYISLSRNGIAGKIKILKGKFNINEDRFLLIPKTDLISNEFIQYTVEPILRGKRKGREGHDGKNEFTKLSFTLLDTVKIDVPIDDDGNYDLSAQLEIAKKYSKVYSIKLSIQEKLWNLISTGILMDE